MQLTRNHWFNALFWGLIIFFMGYKSIQHTVEVHDQGVGVAIQRYQTQAQARINHIKTANYTRSLRSPGLTKVFEMIDVIGNTNNPYDYIQLNDELTDRIDQSIDSFKLTTKDQRILVEHQKNVKQESLIFHSHVQTFNRLIQRVPYAWVAQGHPVIVMKNPPIIDGVIVER